MTQANPPVGLSVWGGVWGTDLDHDTTRVKTGDCSVKFFNTTPGTDTVLYDTVGKPCTPGDLFRVSGWVNADNTDVSALLRMNWYDSADSYLSASTIHAAAVSDADTWEYKSAIVTAPASTAFWRPTYGKSNVATALWWDSVFVEAVEPAFFALLSADQALDTSTPETIIFDDDSTAAYGCYDHGGWYDNGTGIATTPASGTYVFTAKLVFTGLNAGDFGRFYFYWGSLFTIIQSEAVNSGGYTTVNGTLGPIWIAGGTEVKIKGEHDYGSSRNVDGYSTQPVTFFCGSRIS